MTRSKQILKHWLPGKQQTTAAIIVGAFSTLLLPQVSWANLTPQPVPGCGGLEWNATEATNINIHRDNGEYIESIPGNSVVWAAPESGSYFLVGADGGDWRDWTRSASLFVDVTESSGCVDPNLLADNFEFNVLSATEIEITWDIDALDGARPFSHVEVIRTSDGSADVERTEITGTRYYADDLLPNTNYTFATTIVDQYGLSGDSVSIYEVSTPAAEVDPENPPGNPPPPGGEPVIESGDVSVSDNTLSWPDNGWYQVQDANTFATLCEGGRSCIVPAGTYIVINHNSGERFSNITVQSAGGDGAGGSGSDGDDSQVSLTGGTISWPDDGWYQVQDARTYATVCEGGRSCDVEPGVYNVINLSTGERYESIEVTAGGVATANSQSQENPDWIRVAPL